jgi:hypothetical protein
VGEVSFDDARQAFRDHLKNLDETGNGRKGHRLTAGERIDFCSETQPFAEFVWRVPISLREAADIQRALTPAIAIRLAD